MALVVAQRRHDRAATQPAAHDEGGREGQQEQRPEPQEPRQGPQWRPVENEVAVSLHQEVLDRFFRRTLAPLLRELQGEKDGHA